MMRALSALGRLREGNARFVADLHGREAATSPARRHEVAAGQEPFAILLGCSDSRVPAEIVFDQGLGDIFSVRIAGNCVNEDILGSMEFACKVAGADARPAAYEAPRSAAKELPSIPSSP